MLCPFCVLSCLRQSVRQAGCELGMELTVCESVRASHDSQSQTKKPNKQCVSKAHSYAFSLDRENWNRGTGRGWQPPGVPGERLMSLARFPWFAVTLRVNLLQSEYTGLTCYHLFISYLIKSDLFFSACICRSWSSALLWLLWLCHYSLKGQERWRGISNIDQSHRSIFIYVFVNGWTEWSGSCSDVVFLLSLPENLYHLGAPQSSIEGLEDMEVGSLFVLFCPNCCLYLFSL